MLTDKQTNTQTNVTENTTTVATLPLRERQKFDSGVQFSKAQKLSGEHGDALAILGV